MARLTAVVTGDAKARAEDGLTLARDALAAMEEDRRRLKAEVARLEVERTSPLLELEASKDEAFSLHSQAGNDKEAIEEDYQKALEHIFGYGYGCCAFKHNIYGDQPRIPDGMFVTPPTRHPVSSEGVIFIFYFYKLITFKLVHSYNVKHLTCTIFCSSGLQNIYKLHI